jgi:hypothetical protein
LINCSTEASKKSNEGGAPTLVLQNVLYQTDKISVFKGQFKGLVLFGILETIFSLISTRNIIAAKRYRVDNEFDIVLRKREVAIHLHLRHTNVTRFVDLYGL